MKLVRRHIGISRIQLIRQNKKGLLSPQATAENINAIVGGLETNQGETAVEQNADVKAAFDKALDGLVGCSYEPVAYLGSQVVAGTNYLLLCRTTPVVPNAVSAFSLVTIYADLSGNAELTDVTDVAI